MLIAVISDTHLRSPSRQLVELFESALLDADVLLHCGDITGEETLALLMTHPRFHGVAGNMDDWPVQSALPHKTVISAGGLRIGLVHGWGLGADLPLRVATLFSGSADLVCFGHSHRRTLIRQETGPVLINPGSLTSPRDGLPGYAVIQWNGSEMPSVGFRDI
jgi:uncharacterized protein